MMQDIRRRFMMRFMMRSGMGTLVIVWALGGAAFPAVNTATAEAYTTPSSPSYPLKVSTNGRYLVDQNNMPFMIVGDSPQSLIGRLSTSDAALYMANRWRYGINTLWVHLLCNDKIACHKDGTTFDGTSPFMMPGDITKPNAAYFGRVEEMLKIAAAHGITIMLDVVETSGWLVFSRPMAPRRPRP